VLSLTTKYPIRYKDHIGYLSCCIKSSRGLIN
jgi:hypothetical protein